MCLMIDAINSFLNFDWIKTIFLVIRKQIHFIIISIAFMFNSPDMYYYGAYIGKHFLESYSSSWSWSLDQQRLKFLHPYFFMMNNPIMNHIQNEMNRIVLNILYSAQIIYSGRCHQQKWNYWEIQVNEFLWSDPFKFRSKRYSWKLYFLRYCTYCTMYILSR